MEVLYMVIATFPQLLGQYIKEKSLSPASIKTYSEVLKKFQADTKISRLDEVNFELLLDWRLDVIERSSDVTWNNYLRHMRVFWNFAISKQYVSQHNPFTDLNWGKHRVSKKKTISQEQLLTITRYLSAEDCPFEPPWFWKTIVRFMYYTGLRRRQTISLTWGDIDLDHGFIQLSENFEKTGVARELPIQFRLINALTEYRAALYVRNPRFVRDECQLFNITLLNAKYQDDTMSVDQLSGFFKRLSKKVGIRISPHMLRHTMATEIAKAGQIRQLQEILGHQDVRTTLEFYVHPSLEEMNSLMNKLSDI